MTSVLSLVTLCPKAFCQTETLYQENYKTKRNRVSVSEVSVTAKRINRYKLSTFSTS